MKKRLRITADTAVDFADNDKLLQAVATREQSMDYLSLLHYLPNPDPVLKKAGKDIEVYDELKVDPQVASCLGQFIDGVQSLEWEIDKGKSKSRNAKLIKSVFDAIDTRDETGGMNRIIAEILEARLYGFQPLEVMWEKQGGLVLPVDIVGKAPRRFRFDAENRLMLITRNQMQGELVPDYKFLVPTHRGTYDNPYGTGVLSMCFWPVAFKKGGIKFLLTFAEKYGMPYIVGKHEFTELDKINSFIGHLENLVQDGIIAIDNKRQNIDVVTTGQGTSAEIYERLVTMMERQISLAILHHADATSQTPGKLGNEDGTAVVRQSVVNASKTLVAQTMNVLIRWIFEVNGLQGDIPKFLFFEEDDVDMEVAQRDEILSRMGVQFSKSYLMRAYGFDEEDIEVSPAQPPVNFTEDQTIKDGFTASTTEAKNLHELGADFLEPLLAKIDSASSYEDLLSDLASMLPEMPTEAIEAALTRNMAAAHTLGRHHA